MKRSGERVKLITIPVTCKRNSAGICRRNKVGSTSIRRCFKIMCLFRKSMQGDRVFTIVTITNQFYGRPFVLVCITLCVSSFACNHLDEEERELFALLLLSFDILLL